MSGPDKSWIGENFCDSPDISDEKKVSDSIQALVKAFADRRAILLADAAGGVKYIEVLNPAEAGVAHRTAPRLLVILLSIVATLLLCCAIGWYVRVAQGAVNRDKS